MYINVAGSFCHSDSENDHFYQSIRLISPGFGIFGSSVRFFGKFGKVMYLFSIKNAHF